ncbi:hypothetical protein AB0C29_03750 [Actinoplanes sp. NPDC048791]|uniref:hypothetical protein n=1 Tax=Actinoplanes sp. NPDC048791 TaxID=3154623 RepID=UPI003401E194
MIKLRIRCGECDNQSFDRDGAVGKDGLLMIEDHDEYDWRNPLETRGQWEQISFKCPAGHLGGIVTADHKGDQFLALMGSARLFTTDGVPIEIPQASS